MSMLTFLDKMTREFHQLAAELKVDVRSDSARPALMVFAHYAATVYETGMMFDETDAEIAKLEARIDALETQISALRTDGN